MPPETLVTFLSKSSCRFCCCYNIFIDAEMLWRMLIEILCIKVTNFCSECLWRADEHCSLLLKHLNLFYNLLPFLTCDTIYNDMWLATGWTVRGSNPSGARFFVPVQTGPGAHPGFSTIGTVSFPGVKSGRGMTLIPHSLIVPWSWKSRAIPLLPLWTVRPVQNLSACTRVHFTLQ
jgi:hypothetical protein